MLLTLDFRNKFFYRSYIALWGPSSFLRLFKMTYFDPASVSKLDHQRGCYVDQYSIVSHHSWDLQQKVVLDELLSLIYLSKSGNTHKITHLVQFVRKKKQGKSCSGESWAEPLGSLVAIIWILNIRLWEGEV